MVGQVREVQDNIEKHCQQDGHVPPPPPPDADADVPTDFVGHNHVASSAAV